MSVKYWIMSFFKPRKKNSFSTKGTRYISNDPQLYDLYLITSYAEDSEDSEHEDEDEAYWFEVCANIV
ncbi:hypothetical protein SNOG_12827 [Parastagonospora nodorum SN15]|uniref:Uncharacterized protein n=1 Tax=Phaeosphaeria nodorum (strain SN15 / ATCC MYA-4574 / FGSC 10173) TaxID=321614 RepID=Q0U5Y7_PHANO|nr:hypothetical protein SNOG_12827 [Parastagonospora nodorum SN15]EAT79627.1 hypothetical protein SNOG_12827 [Parastagonospora nodorum SN15]